VDPCGDGTPLYYASHGGHADVCEYLLQSGARCDETTQMGQRVFYAALNDSLRTLLKSYSLTAAESHPFRFYLATLLGKASCGDPSEGGGDVVFLVGGEAIWAHRFVLATRCPYLGERFSPQHKSSSSSHCGKWYNLNQISIEHESVTPTAFRGLLQWLYTGRVELPAAHVRSFRLLCRRCRLYDLLEQIPGEENSKPKEEEKDGRDRVVKMGQLILDDGNDALLESFHQLAAAVIQGESLGFDIRIQVPTHEGSEHASTPSATIMPLHCAILTTQSPYLRALLTTQNGGLMFQEAAAAASDDVVKLHDMPLPIFRVVVTYLYSGRLELEGSSDSPEDAGGADGLDMETIYNVLEAAEVLLIPRLKSLCGSALAAFVSKSLSTVSDSGSEKESSDNACDAANAVLDGLEISLRFEIDKLEEHCYAAIAQHMDLFFNIGFEESSGEGENNDDPRVRLEKMIVENAWSIKGRQAADSIPIIDGIRGALGDIFRESSELYDFDGETKYESGEQNGEFFRRKNLVDDCLEKLGLTTATGSTRGAMPGVLAYREYEAKN
jgi:ankyrin repeat/BTB/POZ domain-containing protein 1